MPTGYPGTKAPHGTITRYISHGCRCDECRDASRRYYGRWPRAEVLAEIEPPHGTESRYTSPRFNCRCDLCRAASAAARRARRRSAALALPGVP